MTRKQFIIRLTNLMKLALKLNNERVKYGITALEDEVEDIDDEFFKHGLRLILLETDPKIISEILSNKEKHEKNKNKRMYNAAAKRAVLGIQEGYSFTVLFQLLISIPNLSHKEKRQIEYEILLNDDLNFDA